MLLRRLILQKWRDSGGAAYTFINHFNYIDDKREIIESVFSDVIEDL